MLSEVNPDTIPRYAPPSPSELRWMIEVEPGNRLVDCWHGKACTRAAETMAPYAFDPEEPLEEQAAEALGCCDCEMYQSIRVMQ